MPPHKHYTLPVPITELLFRLCESKQRTAGYARARAREAVQKKAAMQRGTDVSARAPTTEGKLDSRTAWQLVEPR